MPVDPIAATPPFQVDASSNAYNGEKRQRERRGKKKEQNPSPIEVKKDDEEDSALPQDEVAGQIVDTEKLIQLLNHTSTSPILLKKVLNSRLEKSQRNLLNRQNPDGKKINRTL